MRASFISIVACGLFLCSGALAQQPDGGKPAHFVVTEKRLEYPVAASITIEADGSVSSFTPTPDAIPSLRALLLTNSARWRFQKPLWHGQPVRVEADVVADIELIKRSDGAYSALLRSVEWKPVKPSGGLSSAQALLGQRHDGGTFVYAVTAHVDGSMTAGDLLLAKDGDLKDALDTAARKYIGTWRMKPIRVGGQPIQCRREEWVTFMRKGGPWLLPDTQVGFDVPDKCPSIHLLVEFSPKVLN